MSSYQITTKAETHSTTVTVAAPAGTGAITHPARPGGREFDLWRPMDF